MLSWIWKLLTGGFLIAHGLLHWRFDMSRSWLGGEPFLRQMGSILWGPVVVGFVAAGLGIVGVPLLHEWWRVLAIASALFSLVLLLLAWHPWLTLGVLIDAAILAASWMRWLEAVDA